LKLSERRVCRVLGQHRSTQRRVPVGREDEERLTADFVELARRYGRYGYRKIAELLRSTAGWVVNDKRVERIWRREGLKVPAKQQKRGRLWLSDGFGSHVSWEKLTDPRAQTATLNGKTKRKIMAGGPEKRSSMWVSMVDTRFFPRRLRRLGGLLLPIGLPALLDQIGVYVFDVLVA
jgi:HTH-like domain